MIIFGLGLMVDKSPRLQSVQRLEGSCWENGAQFVQLPTFGRYGWVCHPSAILAPESSVYLREFGGMFPDPMVSRCMLMMCRSAEVASYTLRSSQPRLMCSSTPVESCSMFDIFYGTLTRLSSNLSLPRW